MEKLQYKAELGKTGLKVPPIIFGTSALGNLYKALTDETKLEIISNWFQWVDSPVVIDTAGKYGAGLALEEIGNGLRALNVRPDDIIISNKLGWLRTELIAAEPTFETGVWVDLKNDAVQKISYDGIMECYEQGLQLLGGSYNTEMLSVHDPDEYLAQARNKTQRRQRMNDILEAYQALFELKKQRKATAIGIGSKDWKIIKLISEKVELDWVMLATTYTIMSHPKELIDFINDLAQRNISVINSAVFHGGFLTGSDYYNYVKLDRESEEARHLIEWRDQFYKLCARYSVKPSDACILFGLSHPGIIGIALNTSRPQAIEKNVALMRTALPGKFWEDLKKVGLIDKDYHFV